MSLTTPHGFCQYCDKRRELVPVDGGEVLACNVCDAVV